MKKMLSAIFIAMFLMPIFNASALDLSFEDAVSMIVKESHDLKKADANLKKAEVALDAVNANRWFNVEASASYMNLINVKDPSKPMGVELPPQLGGILGSQINHIEFPDNIMMVGVSVSQPIYTFGKIGHAVDSMKMLIKSGQAGKEMALREMKYAAAQLYLTAKMTDEIVEISQSSLNDAKSARKKLTSAGRASRANLVKIEADIASKEINLSNAKFNRDSAYRMLKIMAGIEDADIKLTGAFPKSFDTIERQNIDNPEWEVMEMQAQMYESDAKSKRAGYLPTIAAVGSYNYIQTGTSVSNAFDSEASQSAYWGLNLSVPIFDGGLNRANATMAVMDAEAVWQDLYKSKKIKSEEYNTALQKFEHLKQNLSDLQNARDLAKKAYGYSRDRFAAGQTSAIELSEVSSSLTQMDLALVNTRFEIIMTMELIKKFTGQE